MNWRIRLIIVLSIVFTIISVYGSGVRLTTDLAQRKAKIDADKVVSLGDENKQLRDDYDNLERRHEQLIKAYRAESNFSGGTGIFSGPGSIRLPGSSSGSNGDDTSRVIRRNNTTTNSGGDNDDNDDNDENGSENRDSDSGIRVPEIPEIPEVDVPDVEVPEVEVPDIDDTVRDLVKDTPLRGIL